MVNNNQPLRVLYVNGGTMDMGGISAYMMNYYRRFDKSRLQIDFIVHGSYGVYDDEIIKMGGRVFHIPTKSENYFKNQSMLHQILKSNHYVIIHGHMDGMNGPLLKSAFHHDIPVRISHSHNIRHLTNNAIKLVFHEIARKQIPEYATDLWACSKEAGEWLYGIGRPFQIVPNAIDVSKFRFDLHKRIELRRELSLSGKYVIGLIGRFDYQKNQEYLIDAFAKVCSRSNRSILLLIGDGKDRDKIETQIQNLGIKNRVILMGARNNVSDLLNVLDLFVMPSRFEGLGIAAIEAQCNGLHCLLSDNVPDDTKLTGNVETIPLDNQSKWVDAMQELYERDVSAADAVIERGYDISSAAYLLQRKYLEMAERW